MYQQPNVPTAIKTLFYQLALTAKCPNSHWGHFLEISTGRHFGQPPIFWPPNVPTTKWANSHLSPTAICPNRQMGQLPSASRQKANCRGVNRHVTFCVYPCRHLGQQPFVPDRHLPNSCTHTELYVKFCEEHHPLSCFH